MTARRQSRTALMIFTFLLAAFALGACEESKELTVTGVDPAKGKYLGGDHVYIKGTGFKSGLSGVYFGGKKATNCSVESTTRIMCDSPAGTKDAVVDVEVQFEDSRHKTLEKAFTFIDPIGEGPTNTVPTTPSK
jgi:hypothetical protein